MSRSSFDQLLIISLFLTLLVVSGCQSEKQDHQGENKSPCFGDPCFNPRLAMQKGGSKFKGARFGKVRDGGTREHNGLDLQMPKHSKLYAMYDGYIWEVGRGNGWGDYIIYLSTVNSKQVFIMYAHINKAKVRQGEFVKAGDLIAISGDSGNLKGAIEKGYVDLHMHMEVREVDPEALKRDVSGGILRNCRPLDPEDFMSTEIGYNGRPRRDRPCHTE